MEKSRHVKGQQCMSKNRIYSWLWKSSTTRQQYCRLESFAMKTDIPMNGSMVKKHISSRTGFGYPAIRRTSFYCGSRLVKFVLWIFINFKDIFETRESFLIIFFNLVFFTYSKWKSESRAWRSDWKCYLSSASVKTKCWWWIRATWGNPSQSNPKNKLRGNHDRTGRPFVFWHPGVAARIQGKFGGWWNSNTWRFSRQFLSWSIFRAHIQETWGFG